MLIIALAFLSLSCQPQVSCPKCPVCPKCPDCTVEQNRDSHNGRSDNKSHKTETADTDRDPSTHDWFVIHVTDGDTIVVKQSLKFYPDRRETIRLLNINTPERGEPLYKDATEALKMLVRGGDVTLKYKDPEIETRGHYGRLLAYVFSGGKNVNIELVKLGYTTYWTKYGKSRFDKEFITAQREAKKKHLGLWSQKDFIKKQQQGDSAK